MSQKEDQTPRFQFHRRDRAEEVVFALIRFFMLVWLFQQATSGIVGDISPAVSENAA
jgi:hypothetical protein